ncbi:XAC2610-related protein [Niabella sp. CJ426]|uniref:XAC2610-related protein n=1 Tax=Niabella sp. CJ426 TaxID=3393740 RepID=UPI003CFE8677
MLKYRLFIVSFLLSLSAVNIVAQNKFSFQLCDTIRCDSIYPNKNYQITLTVIGSTNEDENIPNTLFTVSRLSGGKYMPIFSDAVFSKTRTVEFADYNDDKIPDILVHNISDVRSNQTYYLYLVDTAQNKLKKIKGFEVIKNPAYLPQYKLITNYVMSGQIWTGFYKIKGNSIKDFGIVIYDNQTDDGSYDRDYKKAVKSILKKERRRR